jgi:hypothetical protein
VFGTAVGGCTRISATKAIFLGILINGKSSHSPLLFCRWRIRKYTSAIKVFALIGGSSLGTIVDGNFGNNAGCGVGSEWDKLGGGGANGNGCMTWDDSGGGTGSIASLSQLPEGFMSLYESCASLDFSHELASKSGGFEEAFNAFEDQKADSK